MAPIIIDNLHKYGIEFQTKVIAGILSEKSFAERIRDIAQVEMFENDAQQWIFSETISYLTQYKELPTMEVFRVRVDTIKQAELRSAVIGQLKQVYLKSSETDLTFIRDQFLEFCKNQALKKAILDSADILKTGEYEQIRSIVDTALKAGMEKNLGHNYHADLEDRMNSVLRKTVSTGIPVLDSLMDGGLGPGELGIFISPSGIGKSWLLSRLGANAMKQGENVVHITLELNEGYVGLRYDCCFTKINFQEIKHNKDVVRAMLPTIPGSLNVAYYPIKTISAQSVKYHIEKVEMITGKKTGLLVLDYPDLLRPIEKDKNSNSYSESGGIYEELRMIAGELRIPVWGVSQCNRSGATEDTIQAHNVAESYKKIMTADFVASLMRNLDDKANNTARFHIMKNRFGPDGMTFFSKFNSGNGDIEIYDEKSKESAEIQSLSSTSESGIKKMLKQQWDRNRQNTANDDSEN